MFNETAKRWETPVHTGTHSLPRDLPTAIAKLLLTRGVDSAEKLRLFLDPPQQLPYNPMRMAGMDQAVARLNRALDRGERVGVFGDFDVDGVTGAAILGEGLGELGISVQPYLPHRMEEGHGLSEAAVGRFAEQGVSLIITVDTGVTAVEEVAAASRLGTDVIITDHHVPHADLPEAASVIDPNLPDSAYPFSGLCGAGLALKLMQGVYQFLGQPWNPALLELAALGTIADLVPLLDENRYLVQEGLAEMGRTLRPGLSALFQNCRLEPGQLDSEAISFQVCPRLNSAGRMGHAEDSYRLLTTKSTEEAYSLAASLEQLNRTRRDASDRAMAIASEQVQRKYSGSAPPPILVVCDAEIVPGVAGLVAGRLAETYRRPALVMSLQGDHAVASGRSIPQFDIEQALESCRGMLVKYGGHSQAAGCTVSTDQLPGFIDALTGIAEKELGNSDLKPGLSIDAEISLGELNQEAIGWLTALEPFGQGNPRPLFLSRNVSVLETRSIGNAGQHLKLLVEQDGKIMTALAFNQASSWPRGAARLDLAYSVTSDWWRGVKSDNLKVVDVRPSAT